MRILGRRKQVCTICNVHWSPDGLLDQGLTLTVEAVKAKTWAYLPTPRSLERFNCSQFSFKKRREGAKQVRVSSCRLCRNNVKEMRNTLN